MSEVEQQVSPSGMNGTAGDDEVHLMTEEELEKGKLRPPDIDQDMKVSETHFFLCF